MNRKIVLGGPLNEDFISLEGKVLVARHADLTDDLIFLEGLTEERAVDVITYRFVDRKTYDWTVSEEGIYQFAKECQLDYYATKDLMDMDEDERADEMFFDAVDNCDCEHIYEKLGVTTDEYPIFEPSGWGNFSHFMDDDVEIVDGCEGIVNIINRFDNDENYHIEECLKDLKEFFPDAVIIED
jgi:hypothetical protein